MDNKRKHSKRVFAMLLAIIMCLSQAVTAAADEVSANETVSEENAVPEASSEETEEAAKAVPEETVSEEAAPEEPEEAVSGEVVPVEAEPEEAAGDVSDPEDFTYEENDNGITITGLKDGVIKTGSLVIPGEIDGKTVTAIGNQAFYYCTGFTGSLTIPNTVITIGNYAFGHCSGFSGSLVIPNTVVTIGNKAFKSCSGFSGSLTIGNSVKTIDEYAFDGCNNLTGNLTIPDGVTTIGEGAFGGCKGLNGTLTIPNSVTTIGSIAFEECYNISRITNNSAVSMPVEWFWKYDDNKTICFKDANGNKYYRNSHISKSVYQRKVDIPPEAVSLNKANLYLVVNESETLSVNVTPETTIYDEVTWSSSVPEIATVSNGVVTAKKRGRTVITATTVSGGLTARCNVAVNMYGDLYYEVSDNEVIITGHRGGTNASGSLVIPASINVEDHNYPVTTIGESAFANCRNLSGSLTIPDSVTTIGKGAFSCCSGFTGNLIIPDNVTTIGNQAFAGCIGFTGNLTIGKSVKEIYNYSFQDLSGLSGDLIIPASLETIEGTAPTGTTFSGCTKFSRIINNSDKSFLLDCFWPKPNVDPQTKCFRDANGKKYDQTDYISTGVYERKIDTPPTGVVLDQTTLEVNVGTPGTLKAILSPSNTYWDEVSWNSSDKTVATVSNGVVTGLKPGNTVITVTTVSGPFSASCNVTVKRIPVTGVMLNKSAISMYPGETETLTATVTPAEASQAVKWFSSNEKVATVDNGRVTSVSPGNAVITVSTNDGGFTATCAVRVFTKTTAHKVTFLTDDGKPYATQTIENGKQATDPGSPSKSGYIFIGWSDGTSIWNFTTPVNKDLTLIAKYKAEQAVVSENTGSGMDPTPVVDEPEKKGEKTAYKLYLVKGQTFTAGGKDWTTSDTTIVSVAKNTGKITAKSKGTATVTNDTAEYTVYVAAPSVSKNSKTVTVLVGQSAEVGIDLQAVEGKESKYPITWYSANPKVAAVNGGMVTGIAKGSAKVTAYIGGKAYSATVKVIDTCKAPSKIKENKAEFSMNPLQSFNVKFDSNVFTIKNAVWSGDGMKPVTNKGKITGSENSVISITTAGKFTAIGPGTTTVTGTDKNSKTVTLTVTVVPISTKGMAYITKDKTDTIKFPKVTNSKADSWKSSNENAVKFATNKKDGKVKGVGCGMSNISCVYKGFTFTTPVYVEDPVMVFGGKEVKNKEKVGDMKVGEMKQFKVNNTYQTLNYKSSKQANVFVDENGFVYARKKGKANISTKINGTTYQIAIEVKE